MKRGAGRIIKMTADEMLQELGGVGYALIMVEPGTWASRARAGREAGRAHGRGAEARPRGAVDARQQVEAGNFSARSCVAAMKAVSTDCFQELAPDDED